MAREPVPILHRRSALRLGAGSLAATLTFCEQTRAGSESHSLLEANKALGRRVFADVINQGDVQVTAELYAPDFPDPTRAARRLPRLAGRPVPLHEFLAVFPGDVVAIEDMIAEGDLLATRVTWQHEQPTEGNPIAGCTMHFSRVVNGRIVEEWSVGWDWLDQYLPRFFPRTNPLLTP